MAVYHPRSGITHHLRYFFPHIRLVTVDTAIGAGRFLLSEQASIETPPRICVKIAALRAEIFTRAMLTVAVESHHRFNRLLFTEYSAVSVVCHAKSSLLYFTHTPSEKNL